MWMKRISWIWTAALTVIASMVAGEQSPIEIGSRLEPFVDALLIEKMDGAELRMHEPRAEETVLFFNEPWEGAVSAYVSVFNDGDVYRMYYRGAAERDRKMAHEVTCYAESGNGVLWNKPVLGLFEFQGSKSNNIVWMGEGVHNFAPFLDERPNVPAEEKYKALAGGPLLAFVSADAIHWRKLSDKPVITKGAFDSQNLAFWSEAEGKYVCYFRVFVDGVRAVARCTSEDFVKWTEPQTIAIDGPVEHLYTNATTPYFRAPHIYMSFPMRFVPGMKVVEIAREPGISDGVFMTSRDGVNFTRTFHEAFVRPGRDPRNWTDRNNMAAWGVVPTGDGEISMYYSEHYRHPTANLRRRVMRLDGFASIHAAREGEVVTRPVVFAGEELVINYSTSAGGRVAFELIGENGRVIEGFAMADCEPVIGDEIERVVKWKGGSDLAAIAGKPIRLRIQMKDADLYSIRFRN